MRTRVQGMAIGKGKRVQGMAIGKGTETENLECVELS